MKCKWYIFPLEEKSVVALFCYTLAALHLCSLLISNKKVNISLALLYCCYISPLPPFLSALTCFTAGWVVAKQQPSFYCHASAANEQQWGNASLWSLCECALFYVRVCVCGTRCWNTCWLHGAWIIAHGYSTLDTACTLIVDSHTQKKEKMHWYLKHTLWRAKHKETCTHGLTHPVQHMSECMRQSALLCHSFARERDTQCLDDVKGSWSYVSTHVAIFEAVTRPLKIKLM